MCVPRETLRAADPASTARSWLGAVPNGDTEVSSDSPMAGFCLPTLALAPPPEPPTKPPQQSPPPQPLLPPTPIAPPHSPPPLLPPSTSQASSEPSTTSHDSGDGLGCKLIPGACQLEQDAEYCFFVQAVNEHSIAGGLRSSNGVRLCGPPVAGTVKEISPEPVPPDSIYFGVYALTLYSRDPRDDEAGPMQDRDITFENVLRVRWFGFQDTCALGIETYTVTLLRGSYDDSGTGINTWEELNSTSVGRGNRNHAREMSFVLEAPGLHRVRVCGMAVTGLSSCSQSDGLFYDVTPPIAPELCLLAGPYRWCAHSGSNVVAYVSHIHLCTARVTFYGAADAESRVAGFSWAVGTTVGRDDVREWLHVGWTTSVLLVPLEAVPGAVLFVTVVCTNGVGLQTNVTIQMVIDDTPPIIGAAMLQLPSALGWEPGATLFANSTSLRIEARVQEAVDLESPIAALRLDLYDVDAWIDTASPALVATTSLDATGDPVQSLELLDATPRSRYQAIVYAENKAGLWSSTEATLVVDLEPPINGEVHVCRDDGVAALVQVHNDSLTLCSSAFIEPMSGIPFHRVSLLRHATGEALLSQLLVPHAPLMRIPALDLPCDETIEVLSEALSGASVPAAVLRSRVRIDCVRPSAGVVGFKSAHTAIPSTASELFCSVGGDAVLGWWHGFEDSGSAVSSYEYALLPSAHVVVRESDWEPAGPRQLALLQTARLEPAPFNHTLYVRACDAGGLCSDMRPSGRLVLTSAPPVAGAVMIVAHCTEERPYFLSDSERLAVEWEGFSDASHALTPLEYEVCLGTTPYGCQLGGYTAAGVNTTWQGDVLSLPCGATIFATVRATNCAGLSTSAASQGATLCCNPPTSGTVTIVDTTGDTIRMVSEELLPSVGWSGFSDACSGVRDYEILVRHALTSALVWKRNTTRHRAVPLAEVVATLTHSESYIVTITATSFAGHSASSSTSFLIDRTPPVVGSVEIRWDVTPAGWRTLDASTCVPNTAEFVEVRWPAHDAESEIAVRELALTERLPPSSAANWVSLASAVPLRLTTDSLFGENRNSTVLTARVCNSVGLCASSNSSASLRRIPSAPHHGQVHLVSPTGASVGFLRPMALAASWTFDDTSGVALQHEVCLGTTPNGCQLMNFHSVGTRSEWQDDAMDPIGATLPCGATVFMAVRATNCATLRGVAASQGAKMCCGPLIAGAVALMDASGNPLRFLGNSSINVSWSGFSDACSGVREYGVALQASDATSLWSLSVGASMSHLLLPADLLQSLPHDSTYAVTVEATSHAGMTTRTTTSFTVDRTPPVSSPLQLRGSKAGASHSCITSSVDTVELTWSHWQELTSEVASYSVAVAPVAYLNETREIMWQPTTASAFVVVPTGALFRDASEVGVAVRGCNVARLCAESDWHYVHLVDMPPVATGPVQLVLPDDASAGFVAGNGNET